MTIINSQQAKLVELLKELDDLGDPDVIAYYLKEQGIINCGKRCANCPLAWWLHRGRFCGIWVHGDGLVEAADETGRRIRVYAPPHVTSFIKLYDAGHYLYLRAS